MVRKFKSYQNVDICTLRSKGTYFKFQDYCSNSLQMPWETLQGPFVEHFKKIKEIMRKKLPKCWYLYSLHLVGKVIIIIIILKVISKARGSVVEVVYKAIEEVILNIGPNLITKCG